MALPLPKVIPDTMAGGGLVTSMRGMNALSNDMLDNQIKGVQAQYAPLTTQADAASKLAYANLMGPQFLAKLMGNQDILANIPDNQKGQILQKLQQAGMGQGTGANVFSQGGGQLPFQPPQNNNSLSGWLGDKLKNIFGGSDGAPQQGQQPPQSQNALNYTQPPMPQQGGGQMTDTNAITGTDPNSEVGQAVTAWMKSPEALQKAQKDGMYTIPEESQLLQWYRGQQGNQQGAASPPQSAPPASGQTPSFSENVGNYKGIVKEGEEAGTIRAKDIKDLNDTVFDADTKLATLNDVNNMISSPEIREIRQLPLAGRHEMGWYAKEGTPAQQQLVGRLYAQMGNIVKDSSRDFAGQFRKGEQQLLQGMKPNDSDTIDAMIGKAESLTTMTKLLRERAAMTSQIMSQYHVNKGQAEQAADKQLNSDKIRQDIHDKLNPTVTLRNPKTGEVVTIPVSEARQGGYGG